MQEAWYNHNWKRFARLFKVAYQNTDDQGQLMLLRSLLCEWRDTRALAAVLAAIPDLAEIKLSNLKNT